MHQLKFDWENPAVIERNKEEGHVIAFSYSDEQQAIGRAEPTAKMTLNGEWKFHWQRGLEGEPADFYRADFDDSAWRTIPVPSVWQTQNTGSVPYYYASTFPRAISRSKGKIPTIDHTMQEIGHYRRTFTLPEHFEGKEVFLHFGAVKAALEVYVNGEYVGYSQGSMTPHEFDVTKYLHSGENLVCARVYRYCDATYLEDQDMWWLCGIYREVYLFCEVSMEMAPRSSTLRPEPAGTFTPPRVVAVAIGMLRSFVPRLFGSSIVSPLQWMGTMTIRRS